MTTAAPVFVSYARQASAADAGALKEALGDDAYLDTSNVEAGESIAAGVVEALFGARVVVAFAEPVYFTRWYCLRELNVALAAFNALVRRTIGGGEREESLRPVVVAVSPAGAGREELDRLPSRLSGAAWPPADDTKALVALVRGRLAVVSQTLGQRLEALDELDAVWATVLEEAAIPPSRNRAGIPTYSLPGELRPTINDAFVGRADELWQIHHELDTLRGGASAAALSGALEGGGGFGKTRLATEYVHRFGPTHYPGGIFWVNADTPERLDEQLHGILRTLRPDVPGLVAMLEAGRAIDRELGAAIHDLDPERPVLYVVDNVTEPEAGSPPLPLEHWCPAVGEVSLLVTSRAHQSVVAGVRSLPVDVLDVEAAVTMLTREYAGRGSLPDDAWAGIATWVGRLPLALELLNASLREGIAFPAELMAMSTAQAALSALDQSAEALRGLVPAGQLRGITEALSLSYELLGDDARLAARLLSHLAPSPVPLEILEALGPPVATPSVRGTLVARSFVARPPPEPAMFGAMHRVLAEFLRAQSGDHELTAVAEVVRTVIRPERSRDSATWALMRTCLPHAEHVFSLIRSAPSSASTAAGIRLGWWIDLLLSAQGLASRALQVGEAVHGLAMAALGAEHADTLSSANNLAKTLGSLGDFDGACRLHQETYEARRRLLGPAHPDTLMSANNLAAALHALGDFDGARRLHQETYEACRRLLGPEDPATLTFANNLAEALRALGDFDGARRQHQETYEACRRLLGPKHPDTLLSANNLAAALHALGDFDGARRLHQETYEACRRLLGPEHPATLVSANNLAETLRALGDFDGARRLHQEAYAARRRLLGPKHPDTLLSANNLAETLRVLGDFDGARRLHQEAYAAYRRVLGPAHPSTLISANNLAATLESSGDADGARRLRDEIDQAKRQD